MSDPQSSYELVTAVLKELNYHPDTFLNCRLIQDGISGASVYALDFTDRKDILKITHVTNGEIAFERSRREYNFYHDLARRIPLAYPKLQAAHSNDHSTVLILAAYQPSPPPAEWTEAEFVEAARQLAMFHAAYWGKTKNLPYRWLKKASSVDLTRDVEQAHGYWQKLREMRPFADVVDDLSFERLGAILSRMETVNAVIRALPLTLCHGDCFSENVLRDADGNLVWADWQEVRLGRGTEDLSFFLQRASVTGAAVPSEAMLDIYQLTLETEIKKRVSLKAIRRGVDAADLWSRILYWPAYMAQSAPAELAAMVETIFALAERLEIEKS